MRLALAILIAVIAHAQSERPPGFVRGIVTTNSSAAFSVLTVAGVLYQYRTDSKTWMERDHERIHASGLVPGEILEVVSDRDPDAVRYARMVHVIPPPTPRARPISVGGQYRLSPPPALTNVVFTGLLVSRDHDRITVRTRFDGEKIIDLRRDTQCLNEGNLVDLSSLVPNIRVYVIAVQKTGGELEAYQVVWGSILEPQP
jgi:hypothetical protein